ncbi:hypothetical protein [Streptomyces mirabilis]|uniref:hypothetical protein n=1 Tax=Streptomyces mirabilis TaxID=68239 RepID=UPI00331B0AA5
MKMNPAKTETMMVAAVTTTELARAKPVTVAFRAMAPWTWASRIEVTRNIW